MTVMKQPLDSENAMDMRPKPVKPQGISDRSAEIQSFDLDSLTHQIIQRIDQQLRTEQERRGIFS
jgi:hypothetical protein